jgi:hypothetical protein
MSTLVRDQRFFPEPGVSGMGGLLDDLWTGLVQVVSGSKMQEVGDQLGKLQDGIVSTYNLIDAVLPELAKAQLITQQAAAIYGPTSPKFFETLTGLKAAENLLLQATRFEFICTQIAGSLKPKADEVGKYISAVPGFIRAAERLNQTMFARIYSKYTAMSNARYKVVQRADALFYAKFGNVPRTYASEGWMAVAIQAVNEIIPQAKSDSGSGMGDPLTVIITIVAIGIVLVGIILAFKSLLSEFNAKNTTIATSHDKFEERLTDERKDYFARGAKAGVPNDKLEAGWAAIEARKKKEQKALEDKLSSGFSVGDIATYGIIGAVVIVGATTVLPMLTKK